MVKVDAVAFYPLNKALGIPMHQYRHWVVFSIKATEKDGYMRPTTFPEISRIGCE